MASLMRLWNKVNPLGTLLAKPRVRKRLGTFHSSHVPRVEPLEPRMLMSTLVVDGTDEADVMRFILVEDGAKLQVTITNSQGSTLARHDFAGLEHVIANGLAGDDTFILDFLNGNPIPGSGNSFYVNGGGQTTPLGDQLIVLGFNANLFPDFNSMIYTALPPAIGSGEGNSGAIDLSGGEYGDGLINFTGLEPISFGGTAASFDVFLPSTDVHAVLENEGEANDGMNLLRSANGTFESISFDSTLLNNLNIHMGAANDFLEVISRDANFTALTSVDTGDGVDSAEIAFNGTDSADVVAFNLFGMETANVQINTNGGNDSVTLGGSVAAHGFVLGGDGDDLIDTVLGTNPSPLTDLLIDGQQGSDTYKLRFSDLTAAGDENVPSVRAFDTGIIGTDTVTFIGTDSGENFTLDEMTLTRQTSSGMNDATYAGFETVSLEMAGGDDIATVNVNQTLATGITIVGHVFGGDGTDRFFTETSPFSELTYDGQNGSDAYELIFNDSQEPSATPDPILSDTGTEGEDTFNIYGTDAEESFTLTGSTIARQVGLESTQHTFSGMEDVILDMSAGNDTANVQPGEPGLIIPCIRILGGTGMDSFIVYGSPATELTLDGGDENDSFDLYFGQLSGTVFVTDSGQLDQDDLTIHATDGADNLNLSSNSHLSIQWAGATIQTIVVPTGIFDAVEVNGGAGDDTISSTSVSASFPMLLILSGGAGNDQVKGGNGNDIILGGDGADNLQGHSGRDLVIGGRGSDRIVGNSDDDIIIAGFTDHDDNVSALRAIMAEWTSARDYSTRVANLSGNGTGTRLNGNTFLNSLTVRDDGDVDVLTGSSGRDWFFANNNDVTDLHANEVTTNTGLPGPLL